MEERGRGSQGHMRVGFRTGGEAASQADVEESLALVRHKVMRDAREITGILRADLPDFMVREVKARLLKNPDHAGRLTDEQGKALKVGARGAGQQAAETIGQQLDDESLWLPLEGEVLAGGAAELKDNPRVYAVLQQAGTFLRELLEKFGFDIAGEDFSHLYTPPTWFIPGKGLLISQVEGYWRNLGEYQSLRSTLASLKAREMQNELESRWDSW